jgi:DNA-binding CsgD family transcriptional regulator
MGWGEGTLSAFEGAGWGGFLLDAQGRVIAFNGEAQRHLGADFALTQGQLAATRREANIELQRLIAAALSPGNTTAVAPQAAVLLPRPNAHSLIVYAIAARSPDSDSGRHAKAVLAVIDLDQPREPAESILRKRFRLTPAETRVAIGFARGRDLEEIAKSQGINVATARTYLKGVLAKTNTRRQAELAILLSRLSCRPTDVGTLPVSVVSSASTRRVVAPADSSGPALRPARHAPVRRRA